MSDIHKPLKSWEAVRSALTTAYLIGDERPGWCLATDAAGAAIHVLERPAKAHKSIVLTIDVGPAHRYSSHRVLLASAALTGKVTLVNERLIIQHTLRYGRFDAPELVAAMAELSQGATFLQQLTRDDGAMIYQQLASAD